MTNQETMPVAKVETDPELASALASARKDRLNLRDAVLVRVKFLGLAPIFGTTSVELPQEVADFGPDDVEVDDTSVSADSVYSMSRKKIPSVLTRPVRQAVNTIKEVLDKYSIPLPTKDRYVPRVLVESLYESLKTVREACLTSIRAWIDTSYQASVEAVRQLTRPGDPAVAMPAAEDLKRGLAISWTFYNVAAPGGRYKDEFQDNLENMMHSFETEATEAMRSQFVSIIDRLAKSLGKQANGHWGKLKDSTIEDFNDICSKIRAMSVIAKDTDLLRYMEDANKIIEGLDITDVRKQDPLRTQIASSFKNLYSSLEKSAEMKAAVRKVVFKKTKEKVVDSTPIQETTNE